MSDAISSRRQPAGDPAGELRARLRRNLRTAMAAKDRQETGVLRCLIAAIDNAQSAGVGVPEPQTAPPPASRWAPVGGTAGASEAPRRRLSHSQLHAVLTEEIRLRQNARADLLRHGRAADAEDAALEAGVI